jgi:hypothetical protein
VIDAAGIVGGVAGGAAGVMLTGRADARATFGLAAVGAMVGLGAGAYLTRTWRNDDAVAMRTALVPARGGGLVVTQLTW